jgi:hypothetical protein
LKESQGRQLKDRVLMGRQASRRSCVSEKRAHLKVLLPGLVYVKIHKNRLGNRTYNETLRGGMMVGREKARVVYLQWIT